MGNSVSIDALRQELWSKELLDDALKDVIFQQSGLMGADANNVIQVSRELQKKKGDVQTFGLITKLTGDGVTGDSELEGNEEAMDSFAEQVVIDQIRNAVRTKGALDSQKVVYSDIEEGRNLVKMWMTEYIEQNLMLKLGGVTNTTLTDVAGTVVGGRALWSNTPLFIPDADTAYTGTRLRYMNTAAATAVDLDSGDTMTLDTVTDAVAMAKTSQPKLQMIERNGDKFYVMFLHTYQARDIKKSTDWKTAQQDARARGEKNPVFKGALGFWSNCLLLESEMVPWLDISVAGNSFRGASTGTDFGVDTARALLCGRQAGLVAQASDPTALTVETFDYKNKTGVAGSFRGGIQKAVFDSKEFGVIAVDTAAVKS